MQTVHDVRALEIIGEIEKNPPLLEASTCARQGDLVLKRKGDAKAKGNPTPTGGTMLIAGAHGEHRVVAESVTIDPQTGTVDLPEGGIVIHTDAPDGRHAAIRCAPGKWQFWRQQELTTDNIVAQVKD